MKNLFVIMPIGSNKSAPEMLQIVSEAAKRYGWAARLPSYDQSAPVFSLNETLEELRASSLVFADLSYSRPSCYYELGLAEALHRPVFAVAISGSAIHQASVRNEVKFYDTDDDFRLLAESAISHWP